MNTLWIFISPKRLPLLGSHQFRNRQRRCGLKSFSDLPKHVLQEDASCAKSITYIGQFNLAGVIGIGCLLWDDRKYLRADRSVWYQINVRLVHHHKLGLRSISIEGATLCPIDDLSQSVYGRLNLRKKEGLPTFGVIDLNCCLSTYRAVCINYYITDNQYRSIHGSWNLIR